MKRIAKFEKVSFSQFKLDYRETFENSYEYLRNVSDEELFLIYENIKLPQRSTKGSAGYDFYSPIYVNLFPYETIKFPTGIRVRISEGWVLKCYPRSGFGFKYRLQLDNSVGIIDQDYFFSDNEGHIFAKITNDTHEQKEVSFKSGTAFMQGIFVEYGITEDDNVMFTRNGGFGSTTK